MILQKKKTHKGPTDMGVQYDEQSEKCKLTTVTYHLTLWSPRVNSPDVSKRRTEAAGESCRWLHHSENSVSLLREAEHNLENNSLLRTLPGEILVNVDERHVNTFMWVV